MAFTVSRRIVLVSAFLIGGCESTGLPDFFSGLSDRNDGSLRPVPEARDPKLEMLARASPGRKPTPPPRPAPPDEPEIYDPGQLIGQSSAELRMLLGQPVEQREQASGLVWTFRHETCALDVVMYSSVAGDDLRVLQYSIEGEASDPDGAQCVGRMVSDARTDRG